MPSFRLAAHLFLRVAAMQAPPSATSHTNSYTTGPSEKPREDHFSIKSSQVKSSQVKFIHSQQKKVFNIKYVKGSTSYTFITLLDTPHVNSISSQQKPSTFLRGLSCASIHTEYYVAGTVVTRQLFRSTVRNASRRPDPKHDRNPPQIGQTKFGETAVHFCTDTHEDVGPTVVDRR